MNASNDNKTTTIIQGRKAVLEALRSSRYLDKILIKDGKTEGSIRAIFAKAKDMGIKIEIVTKRQLDTLAQAHQGVVAFAPAVDYTTVADILAVATKKNQPPFIVILNNITDPHNFGAIIRAAEGAGVHGIIVPSRRAVGITATVEKTSAGAINYIPIAKVANLAQTIDKLKKQNIWIIGADTRGKHYFNIDFSIPLAICIGAEGEGLGNLVTKKCDFIAKIPMHGRIATHNASVAAALVMYEVVKQRMPK